MSKLKWWVVLISLPFAAILVAGYFSANIKSSILFSELKNKNVDSMTTSEKIIMFKSYIDRKDYPNALKVGARFEGHAAELSKEERIYIADHLGRMLRAMDGYKQEMMLYEEFFRNDYPAFYHLFRSSAFENQKDSANENLEMGLAVAAASQENDMQAKIMIEKIVIEQRKRQGLSLPKK